MHFIYSEEYEVDIGRHVFPTIKYKLIHDKLLSSHLAKEEDFIRPSAPPLEDILLVHTKEYIYDFVNLIYSTRVATSELPITTEIVNAYLIAAGGTIITLETALKNGFTLHIGGGWHHAFPDHAEGFCYLNDIAIAIKKLKKQGLIKKAAIIDCDLHQGNGTAKIFESDKDVFTFSIHQENLYPIKQKSTIDVGLPDFADDATYLNHLKQNVPYILDSHKPEIVVYVAGADPYKEDQLGSLLITKEGLRQRDRLIYEECKKRNIPVGTVLAGGYAAKLEDTVDIHFATCEEMLKVIN